MKGRAQYHSPFNLETWVFISGVVVGGVRGRKEEKDIARGSDGETGKSKWTRVRIEQKVKEARGRY